MALTRGMDLYGAVDEEGINRVVRHLFRQRPSLFNFATTGIAAYADEFLDPAVPLSDAQVARDQPRVSELTTFPVLGADGPVELEYSVQLTAFEFDFHPGDEFELPVGGELEPQQFGVHAAFAVGIGCPNDADPEFRRRIRDRSIFERDVLGVLRGRNVGTRVDGRAGRRSGARGGFADGSTGGRLITDGGRTSGSPSVARFGLLPPGTRRERFVGGDQRVLAPPDVDLIRKPDVTMHRFELHAFLVGGVDIGTDEDGYAFEFELDHLELGGGDDGSAIDLPTGLKDSIECYVDLYVRHVVLPSVSETVQNTVADVLDNDLLKTELAPEDPTARFPETDRVPHNPNVADDRLEVYVDLDIAGDDE